MKRAFSILVVTIVFVSLIAACGTAKKRVSSKKSKPKSGNMLEGIGEKKKSTNPRIILKKEFKKIVSAYLAENKEAYLAFFDDTVLLLGNQMSGQDVNATKADVAKKLDTEFGAQDLTKATYDDTFTVTSELFVMSKKELSQKIPVWPFGVPYDDIRKHVQKGDYLVIGKPSPALMDKEIFLNDIYFIFRPKGDGWIVVGRE